MPGMSRGFGKFGALEGCMGILPEGFQDRSPTQTAASGLAHLGGMCGFLLNPIY